MRPGSAIRSQLFYGLVSHNRYLGTAVLSVTDSCSTGHGDVAVTGVGRAGGIPEWNCPVRLLWVVEGGL